MQTFVIKNENMSKIHNLALIRTKKCETVVIFTLIYNLSTAINFVELIELGLTSCAKTCDLHVKNVGKKE